MLTFAKPLLSDAEMLLEVQREAFLPLLERYQDDENNPANWRLEKMSNWILRPDCIFLKIQLDGRMVGGVRARPGSGQGEMYLHAVFIAPAFQGRGLAQAAIRELEAHCPGAKAWLLEVPEKEMKNRHIYEKMGYSYTGESVIMNDRLRLLLYRKEMNGSDIH